MAVIAGVPVGIGILILMVGVIVVMVFLLCCRGKSEWLIFVLDHVE